MDVVLSIIFPVLTVIIGGACLLLFGVTSTLRAQNGDLTGRVTFLEEERKRLTLENETQAAKFDAKMTATTAELDALRNVVTGEVHLVAITDLLTEHHTEAVKNWTHVGSTLQHVDETMTDLAEAIREDKP